MKHFLKMSHYIVTIFKIYLKGINMIVKDKKANIEKANDISNKMMELFSSEACLFDDGGDPAEQIYLSAHTLANLNASFYLCMEGMAKIYGIKSFDGKVFENFVEEIKKEILSEIKSSSDEIVEKFKEQNFN